MTDIGIRRLDLEWEIANVYTLLGEEGYTITSQPFKHRYSKFYLNISGKEGKIELRIVEVGSQALWCTHYRLTFGSGELELSECGEKIELSSIVHTIPINRIENCVDKGKLKVFIMLENNPNALHSETETTKQKLEHEKDIYLKQGSVTLSKSFENMFENSRFSDVTLKVGVDMFQAHKAVLACRSKVFGAMFENGMREGLENEASLFEMKSETTKEMLQYIYTGNIQELSMDRATDLYVAADRYDLQELKDWCKDFILKHISSIDVCRVAVLADLHSDEELADAAKRVFKEKSRSILAMEGWGDFRKKNPDVYADLVESALQMFTDESRLTWS